MLENEDLRAFNDKTIMEECPFELHDIAKPVEDADKQAAVRAIKEKVRKKYKPGEMLNMEHTLPYLMKVIRTQNEDLVKGSCIDGKRLCVNSYGPLYA